MKKENLIRIKNELLYTKNGYRKLALTLAAATLLSTGEKAIKTINDEKFDEALLYSGEKAIYTTSDFEYLSNDKPVTISHKNTINKEEINYDTPATNVNWNDSLYITFEGDEPVDIKELTIEEMFEEVRIAYGLSYEELDTVIAVFCKEAFYMPKDFDGNYFEEGADCKDADNLTSVAINRLHTKRYIDAYGMNLYNQMINGGYQPYTEGTYKQYKGRIDLKIYQTIIKRLYLQDPINDRLEFRAPLKQFTTKYAGSYIQPVKGGNIYIDSTDDEEMIDYRFAINNGKQLILK